MSGAIQAILWGGTACAVLDATAASLQFGLKGINPLRIWQGVASGLLGEPAFRRGWVSGGFGLLLHFAISFTFAAAFVEACERVPALASDYWISGPVYGMLVFLVMNLIVVPLSARPKRQRSTPDMIVQLIIHALFVGLPIAIAAKRSTIIK